MKVDVALTPEGICAEEGNGKRVVVIDVIRASTTIITALAHGAEGVLPLRTPGEARRKAKEYAQGKTLLCGERQSVRIPGFDLGNSPGEYNNSVIRDKVLLYTSTNGSQMLVKVGGAKEIFVAGFVNLEAVVRRLGSSEGDCLIACSGTDGKLSLEDAVCAGMIVVGLGKMLGEDTLELSDEAIAVTVLYEYFAHDLLVMAGESTQGKYLIELGMEHDLPFCINVDSYDVVPVLRDGMLVNENMGLNS